MKAYQVYQMYKIWRYCWQKLWKLCIYLRHPRVLPLNLSRGKASDSTCKSSLNLTNWDYDLLQKLDPATRTEEHWAIWWQSSYSSYSLDSDHKAFWSYSSKFTKHIWEFTREKGTALTAPENAEAKAKTPLVTALRNYNLAVMKAEFLFIQKWNEESLTPTACMASSAAWVILRWFLFIFTE